VVSAVGSELAGQSTHLVSELTVTPKELLPVGHSHLEFAHLVISPLSAASHFFSQFD
jgi:hypothetical protein